MDYRNHIPSSKSIYVWILILSMCAASVLLMCTSCTPSKNLAEVRDAVISVRVDTVKEVIKEKDTSSDSHFQSIVQRLEKEANDIRTLVLSEKGDTIRDYRERVIIQNSSSDSVKWDSLRRLIEQDHVTYQSRIDNLYSAIKEVEEKQEALANKFWWYVLCFALGVVFTLVSIVIFKIKRK